MEDLFTLILRILRLFSLPALFSGLLWLHPSAKMAQQSRAVVLKAIRQLSAVRRYTPPTPRAHRQPKTGPQRAGTHLLPSEAI
jgi:hypothetical protein